MIEKFLKWFEKYGYPGWLVPTVLLAVVLLLSLSADFFADVPKAFITVGPVFLVVLLAWLLSEEWMGYVIIKNFFETPYVLLEIRMPAEITQSPLAMETVLNAFYSTGDPATPKDAYLGGKLNPQFSLEIVSLEGVVHLYIHTQEKWRNTIEAQLYAHYPGIEIMEVPDYVDRFQFDRSKMDLYGIEYTLQKPDAYPIKTYVDYGIDEQTKEEFKVDPINGIFEYFGSLGKGEYGFFQLIIRSHAQVEEYIKHGKAEIKRLVEEATGKSKTDTNDFSVFRPITKDIQIAIERITRNIAKKPFDAGLRILYIADNEHCNLTRLPGIPTMMRSFEDYASNGFKPVFFTYKYKIADPTGKRVEANKKTLFSAYRWRSYLSPPYSRPTFILSGEEIATVWHLPGLVSQTPTLTRITSRRGEAPANLPRG